MRSSSKVFCSTRPSSSTVCQREPLRNLFKFNVLETDINDFSWEQKGTWISVFYIWRVPAQEDLKRTCVCWFDWSHEHPLQWNSIQCCSQDLNPPPQDNAQVYDNSGMIMALMSLSWYWRYQGKTWKNSKYWAIKLNKLHTDALRGILRHTVSL